MNLQAIQRQLEEQKIDAWLLYDFRGSNSVLAEMFPGKRHLTRRIYLLIPRKGEALFLTHQMEKVQFADTGIAHQTYVTWEDQRAKLAVLLRGHGRIAMEYSPGNSLPAVSIVDAGTVELIRSFGVEVVSSADLIQSSVAVWGEDALAQHFDACRKVEATKDAAFAFIASRIGNVSELDVARFILEQFASHGLEANEEPIVGVNAHSGDPHFSISRMNPSVIREGDWVLIDLWSRHPGTRNIYCDITWTGFCGRKVPEKHQKIFDIVRDARDASVRLAQQAWQEKQRLEGWQLDRATRTVIEFAGYGEFFTHRTGHSLSAGPRVHGIGMNLDDVETHDTRAMLPGIGFTVEPGIYLPEFGVRNEINVFVDPVQGPIVTTQQQNKVVLIA